jgi:hypothetical protein
VFLTFEPELGKACAVDVRAIGGNFSHLLIRNRQQLGLYFYSTATSIITHRKESVVKKR